MSEQFQHTPVMLSEAVVALNLKRNDRVLDGTFGCGNHSKAILEWLGAQGHLLMLDRDPAACAYAQQMFADDPRAHVGHASFEQLPEFLAQLGWSNINSVLFDLGLSSAQLADRNRGFSFQLDGPLDMRMNPTQGQDIAAWLAVAPEANIAAVLRDYGEEPQAVRIARAIVSERAKQPIITTAQLAKLVSQIVRPGRANKHPATRVFLALRIKANDELGHLHRGLEAALAALAPLGRLVVITFHSIEDRIVKRFFGTAADAGELPRHLPLRETEVAQYRQGRAFPVIKPSRQEIAFNLRARSALMRVFERAA